MKNLIAIILFAPITLIAQQNGGEFHIGIMGGVETSAITIQLEEESTKAEYGFSSGITFAYNISPNITVQSGLSYGIKNINYTRGGLTFPNDIDPMIGFTGSTVQQSRIQLGDVEIPLQVKYFFLESFYVRTGVGINFLNERAVDHTFYHSDSTTTTLMSDPTYYMNYSAMFGLGFMQPIGEKFNFNIEPYIKYYLIENIIPTTHLYNIGINASFTMRLGK